MYSAVSSGLSYPLVVGVLADGCSSLSFPYSLPGKVVLINRKITEQQKKTI